MQQKAALSLSVVTLVLAATHKTCLGGLPAAVVQQKAALSLCRSPLVLAATLKTCLGGLPAAVVQQKAALSLCRSSLWFSLRLSRPPSKDYQPRSCKEGSSLSVGRHSSSRCDSQYLPQRTTSRGRATEGSSLSLSVVTLVLTATLKTCLEGTNYQSRSCNSLFSSSVETQTNCSQDAS